MSKTFINPESLEFAKLEPSEEEYFYSWLPAADYVAALAARVAKLERALQRIADGNPGKPGQWLADIEMADIARAALAEAEHGS